MHELTLEQTDKIAQFVIRHEIVFSHLCDDLIDHICCDLEESIRNGADFDKAFRDLKQRIGRNGLTNIQEDTLFAVDYKYRRMKRTMKITGVAGTVLLGLASVFKIQHFPGAGIMMSFGALILITLFLPSSLMVLWKESKSGKRLYLFTTGFLASALFIMGVLFKIQHWPVAGIVLPVGILIGIFLFLPSLVIRMINNPDRQVSRWICITASASIAIYAAGFLLKIMHWPGASQLFISCLSLAFLVIPAYFHNRWKNDDSVSVEAIFTIFVVVMFIVPTSIISFDNSRNFEKMFLTASNSTSRNLEFRTDRNKELLTDHNWANDDEITGLVNLKDELFGQIEELENILVPSFRDYKQTLETGGEIIQDQLFLYDNTRKIFDPGTTLLPDLEKKLHEYRALAEGICESSPETLEAVSLELDRYLPSAENLQDERPVRAPIVIIQSLEALKGAILDVEATALRNIGMKSNDTK